MIKEDLYNELKDNAGVSAIVSTRVFFGSPIEQQSEEYITYRLDPSEEYDDVRSMARFRIFCFSKDTKDADDLANAVKTALDGNTSLNANPYYKIHVFSKVDGNTRLNNGFYYTTIRVEIQYS